MSENVLTAPVEASEIEKYLPHRYPFLLLDRVVALQMEPEKRITAIKNVTINEPYFTGHYPGNPVMPGVLQIESMAQAAGLLLLRKISAEGKVALFMSADRVKFRRAVIPGDRLDIEVKVLKIRSNKLATAAGKCFVEGELASSAELMFTVLDVPEEGM